MKTTRRSEIQSLVARLVAVCCVAVVTAGCSGQRSEQYRLEGDSYLGLGKYDQAAESYNKSLAADPANAPAKVGLGRCLLAQDQYADALARFREAIQLDPSIEDAYMYSVAALMKEKRADEAVAVAGEWEKVNPEKAGIVHARILAQTDRLPEAIQLLSDLRGRMPESVDVRVSLAEAHLAAGEPEKAGAELDAYAGKLPDVSQSVRMALIDVYGALGRTAEMTAELDKLVKERPDDAELRLCLARTLLYDGKLDEAEKMGRVLLEERPDSAWANYIVGACLVARNEFAEAVPYLQSAAAALPDQRAIARELAVASSGGRGAQPVESTRPGGPRPAAVDTSDWRSLWTSGALVTLLKGRDGFLAAGGENLAETLVLAAVFTDNMAIAEELAKGLPEGSIIADYLVVLKENNAGGITDLFNRWTEDDADRKIMRENALGHALAQAGARTRAVSVLSACRKSWPDNVVCLYNIAQVFRKAQMTSFAAKALEQLIAQYPNNGDAHTLLFVVLQQGGMEQEARKAAEVTYALFPESREAAVNLAMAYQFSDELEQSRLVLDRALSVHPDDAALRGALVGVLLRMGKMDEAKKALGEVSDVTGTRAAAALIAALEEDWPKVLEYADKDDKSMRTVTRLLSVGALVKTGRLDEAADLLARDEGKLPHGGRLGALIMAALGKESQPLSEDESALAESLGKDQSVLGDFVLAVACQRAQLADAALEKLRKVDAATGGGMSVLHLLMLESIADARRLDDPTREAVTLAQQHESDPTVWLGLASVQNALGNEAGEREAIDKAVEVGLDDPRAWLKLAQFADRKNDKDTVISAYRHVLELRPDDPAANNNLAYALLMSGGDNKEALDRALKAHEKLPASPHVLHTLGLAQFRAGELDKSERNLAVALELRPGDPTLMLDYGQLLIAQGRAEEGKRHIQLAVEYADLFNLDFPRREEARTALAG